jgi:hypothetical protein
MNACDIAIAFFTSLAATLLGLFVILWIERQRRPSLVFEVGAPGRLFPGDPMSRPPCTWLHIYVRNLPLPRWLAWAYVREAAPACAAWIAFFNLDGKMLFDQEMLARWTDTLQPKWHVTPAGGGFAATLIEARNTVDIPAAEYSVLDVAVRMDGEEAAFGWNNESYVHNWRHPSWALPKARLLVRARVRTGGLQFSDAFLLVNDGSYDQFELLPAAAELKAKVL